MTYVGSAIEAFVKHLDENKFILFGAGRLPQVMGHLCKCIKDLKQNLKDNEPKTE